MIGDPRPRQPAAPEARCRREQRVDFLDVGRHRRALVPGQRAVELLPGVQHVPGPSVIGLDPEQHVGLQADRLTGSGRIGTVTVFRQRPLPRCAAVIEPRLAHELDFDAALDAPDGPHEHVLGVLVGRRPGVRGDRILAAARTHHQRVANDRPPAWSLPRSYQRVGPWLIGPAAWNVDPERAEPERAGAPVKQRSEHARRVKPRHAQPIDRAIRCDQRSRMTVRHERIVGDRGERRRSRCALGHRRGLRLALRGRGRLGAVGGLVRIALGLDRGAHDATHG